ncbi:outer membrane protein assembly factor BamA [Temperatibacter marinus]|uniref:Outer membrane protein assembly factor BamA n=1 Tax=Temperatibacter marinus TaxID=1456591 RepID=A0AA52EGJ2_9PROT|nr:outer membrane protein assembly factor BamA [Temperatibacter marinus]WND02380.1 outer membrane protein assembly factor BamA [Temperatibacter marinus]
MKNIWALSFVLLTVVTSVSLSVSAQAPQQQQMPVITEIQVQGNVRVEGATILQYMTVRAGDAFDQAELNNSFKRLFSTGLFADLKFDIQGTVLVVVVQESPIINRIIFEGNKKLDNEALTEEIRIRPRSVFTRAKVKAEVNRILELYRSKGRFAAIVEPKVVQQSQNRVDVVFEIQEGPKTKVSKINFLGNKIFSDGDLRDVLVTKESRWWKIFSSGDTYDPDKILYDQQQLRNFYLNEGYADFRIISAVAELVPDRSSFIINYTVDEGEIYRFGKVTVESQIRDVNADLFKVFLRVREGEVYSQEAIENSQETLTDLAGAQGYAFIDILPKPKRNKEERTIEYNFTILEAPRVYVERINIHGNVRTLDKVIRREFRLQEGDAFNSFNIKRSEDRLKRLGFFRPEGIEVERKQGSAIDRMEVDVRVEEQSTGDLNFGIGFSSIENFIFNFSINEKNFMGKGQRLGFSMNLSGYQQSANVSFTEPYFLDRNIAAGADIFYRRTTNSDRYASPYESDSKGFSLRMGAALGEFWTYQGNYTFRFDNVRLSTSQIDSCLGLIRYDITTGRYIDVDTDQLTDEQIGYLELDRDMRLEACSQINGSVNFNITDPVYGSSLGTYNQSIIGYTLGFDSRNNYLRPTAGRAFYFSQNYAGLGGDVKYLKSSVNFDNYWTPINGWTLRLSAQGSWIKGIGQRVRLNDSLFLGGPQLRGFDVNAVGPRRFYGTIVSGTASGVNLDDLGAGKLNLGNSVGGTKQYVGRAELFFPLGDAALEMGINASAFLDVGSLWGTDVRLDQCAFGYSQVENYLNRVAEGRQNGAFGEDITGAAFETDCIIGDNWKPRAAIGIGFSWQSPFGPFRIDLTKNLRRQFGDRTQTLQFNIGTSF